MIRSIYLSTLLVTFGSALCMEQLHALKTGGAPREKYLSPGRYYYYPSSQSTPQIQAGDQSKNTPQVQPQKKSWHGTE